MITPETPNDQQPPSQGRPRSRRDFIRLAGLTAAGGSAGLVAACGDGGGSASTGGGGSGEADVGLLNAALDFEYTAVAAYAACAELARSSLLKLCRQFHDQEREHAAGLARAIDSLGGTPRRPKTATEYARSFPRMRRAADVLRFAIDLENKAVASYMDTIPRLSSGELRQTGAAIVSSEAEHLATLMGEQTGNRPARQVPDAFVTGKGI